MWLVIFFLLVDVLPGKGTPDDRTHHKDYFELKGHVVSSSPLTQKRRENRIDVSLLRWRRGKGTLTGTRVEEGLRTTRSTSPTPRPWTPLEDTTSCLVTIPLSFVVSVEKKTRSPEGKRTGRKRILSDQMRLSECPHGTFEVFNKMGSVSPKQRRTKHSGGGVGDEDFVPTNTDLLLPPHLPSHKCRRRPEDGPLIFLDLPL